MPNPTTNAEGLPIIALSEDQRFVFDTRGWLLLPDLLTDGQIRAMRDFCYCLKNDPDSIPAHHRSSIGGPLEDLVDHPAVVGFMDEFVANGYASENCYGFRLESTFSTIRSKGHDNFQPHGGRGILNFPGNSHTYPCIMTGLIAALPEWFGNSIRCSEETVERSSLRAATKGHIRRLHPPLIETLIFGRTMNALPVQR